jgi:hypothetical protein
LGVEAGRQRQDRGRAEQRHRLQEGDQRACQQRRHDERNGDPTRGRPGAAAQDRGRVLEIARNAIKRIGNQHEDIRKRVAGDHEDQAGQRVDVEQVSIHLGAGDCAPRLVDQPGIGRCQKLPRNRAQKRRRHE